MSLGNYIGACSTLADELILSLTPQELEHLHASLKGKKVMDWVRWRLNNENLVAEFVAATPQQRKTRKKFDAERLYLTMAGAQHCLEARALLSVVVNSVLRPGGSYREMAAAAGLAYGHAFASEVPYWPFRKMATPFVDEPGSSEEDDAES